MGSVVMRNGVVNIDTINFRKWLEDNKILDQSTRLFWTHFREQLCSEWGRELGLSFPLREDYISIDFHEACIKIEDISILRKPNPSEYVEIRINVFFKGSYIAHFNVKFDFTGKWIVFETGLSMILKSIREDIIALEGLKEVFEREITVEEYGLDTRLALINIIDRKITTIKDAFE